MQGKQNLGMGDQPARKFFVDLRRRNEFDEWGLELRGGWRGGDTWVEVAYVRRDTPADLAGIRQPQLVSLTSSIMVCVQGGGQTRHRQRHLRGVPARGRGGGAAQRGRATVAWLEVTVLFCTVLYCTVLYCTVQYSVLYCSWSGRPCALSSRRGSWGGGSPARGR